MSDKRIRYSKHGLTFDLKIETDGISYLNINILDDKDSEPFLSLSRGLYLSNKAAIAFSKFMDQLK